MAHTIMIEICTSLLEEKYQIFIYPDGGMIFSSNKSFCDLFIYAVQNGKSIATSFVYILVW